MKGFGLAVLIGGVAASLGSGSAQAQNRYDGEVLSIRVDASAFDLATPSGIDALAQRIHRAVNRICGSDAVCRDEAWASTEDQVAWAIDRDQWRAEMAAQREAQLDACGWDGCATPAPVAYPVPVPQPAPGAVVVTIVRGAPY